MICQFNTIDLRRRLFLPAFGFSLLLPSVSRHARASTSSDLFRHVRRARVLLSIFGFALEQYTLTTLRPSRKDSCGWKQRPLVVGLMVCGCHFFRFCHDSMWNMYKMTVVCVCACVCLVWEAEVCRVVEMAGDEKTRRCHGHITNKTSRYVTESKRFQQCVHHLECL